MVMSAEDEYAPPKYARIVTAIRRKIEDGTYPPGGQLPSEAQLIREFAVSRPTVVRALQVLQLRGIISREHGKGSYVKTMPPVGGREGSRPGRAVLDRVESGSDAAVIQAGSGPAPGNVAGMLSLPVGTPMVMRRLLMSEGDEPVELVTFWCPIEMAEGTDLGREQALSVSVGRHVQAVKGLRLDHVVERLSARHPLPHEVEVFKLSDSAAVLGVLARVFDSTGRVVLVVDIAMPGTLHELDDTYSV
ncbi:GntR family transcriptional regulator [Sphaerisporangium sp. TRM90804]|uniref:GntR family transcriptional regulator n=1 Tax=Sphaerisporangium sp. TRM90804 TaxID=3031113 RepID=UPI0024490443|nr:GntR family transcriptional regulator [Sphaerisporangium sp. TRM90804]MDH2429281.1 GntR family transcriptional regulator [Sphaerisporangium sp. TRM90804]